VVSERAAAAPRRSLVIPVYGNAETLDALLSVVESFSAAHDGDFEAVFVVDGSPDDSYGRLAHRLPHAPFRSQLLAHSRNFGSFAAIRTGLEAARGETIAVMAADLQEPPSLIAEFFEILDRGSADLVVGVRSTRSDGWLSDRLSRLYWALARRVVHAHIPEGGVDVFGCTAKFRDALLQLEERRSSLIAQLFWLGYRREEVPYERVARSGGSSGWTFRKKVAYLADSFYAFSDLPIRTLTATGVVGVTLAVIVGLAVLVARLAGAVTVPGYTPTVLAVVFFGALNLLSLGIVGTYVWRAFENTKHRPLALVSTRHTFPTEAPDG
jgi:polyisoprenyl-phosphate glycosyltransferase